MRYPAIYVATYYFGKDGAGIAAVIGSMAGVLCDVDVGFSFCLVLFIQSELSSISLKQNIFKKYSKYNK